MLHRREILFTGNNEPEWADGYRVTVLEQGSIVSGNLTAQTFIPTYPNLSNPGVSDKVIFGTDITKFRSVSATSPSGIVITPAVSVSDGDRIVDLGPDTGLVEPNYDGSQVVIFSDEGLGDVVSNSTLTTSSQGEYEYWAKGKGVLTELVRNSTGTVVELIPDIREVLENTIFNVKDFGAIGNGIHDDTAAIQAAIDKAKLAGFTGGNNSAGVVYFPPGAYMLSSSLVLPRSGSTPTNIVHLIGENIRSVRLEGLSTFPTNRGLIEWDQTTIARAWHQKIANLTLKPHSSVTTSSSVGAAIWYKTISTDKTDFTAMRNELLQLTLEDILIETSNDSHQVAIYLEGNIKFGSFERIYNDPSVGSGTYNTITFKFDTGYSSFGSDANGAHFSTFSDIRAGVRRGGSGDLIHGRIQSCVLSNLFVGVQGNQNSIALNVSGMGACDFSNLVIEGGGNWNPQIKLMDCRFNRFFNLGLGGGDSTAGNGMELSGCIDNEFTQEMSVAGNASFDFWGTKKISINSTSKRNRFAQYGVGSVGFTTINNEFVNSGTDNYIEAINPVTLLPEYIGSMDTGDTKHRSVKGGYVLNGQLSEELTLSTSGLTTDGVSGLLPTNSIIEGITCRITQTLTGAGNWQTGDSSQAARFTSLNTTLTAGTTSVGLNHRDPTVAAANLGPVQSGLGQVRITTSGIPSQGKVRVTSFFKTFVPPTSN